jgi:hypothetical protein
MRQHLHSSSLERHVE